MGYAGALIAGLYNALIALPSAVFTVMQFRSGALPSLRDMKDFKQYRTNVLQATTLLGGKFKVSPPAFYLMRKDVDFSI